MENNEILSKLIYIYKDVIGDEIDESKVNENTKLVEDLGLNSVGILYLSLTIESEFNVNFENDDISKIKTLGDIVNFIKNS